MQRRFVSFLGFLSRPLGLAATLTAPIGLACDAETDDAEVLGLIDDAIERSNDAIAIVCDCWDEAGFATRSACLDDQILPSQRRCVENAYLREAEASRLYLECVVPLAEELGTCLDAKLTCDAPARSNPCFEDYDLGLKDCITVPNSVERALGDCHAAGSDAGDPAPDPASNPDDPGTDPAPEPGPGPGPAPQPEPDPEQEPGPSPEPEPAPEPTPEPGPAPAPGG